MWSISSLSSYNFLNQFLYNFELRDHYCFSVQSYEKQIWHCPNLSVFVRICQFLLVFETMLFSLQSYEKGFWHCQSMSDCVSLCHFPIYCLFLDAKLQKVNLALSPFVTICHYLSPFVTFQQIAFSRCKVTEKKFGTVRICPHMSGNVRKCPLLSVFRHSNVS